MEKLFNRILFQIETKKNLEDTLVYLRSFNFRFIDTDRFYELYPKSNIPEKYHDYQFMARYLKIHNYDYRLFFALKLWGGKTNQIIIFYENQFLKRLKKDWKAKVDINFRKVIKRWKFPDALTYEERRKWRAEHRKVINPNSKHNGTDWYFYWKKQIIFDEKGFADKI